MHPIIQLTVSVALMVIAARAWPPLLYWLVAFIALLMLIKIVRRSTRWVRNNLTSPRVLAVMSFIIYSGLILSVAVVADYFFPHKISAVTLVLCFAAAYAAVALIVTILDIINGN